MLETRLPADQSENVIALCIRQTPIVHSEDSIGRAAELLRNGAFPALPVLHGNFPIGIITEKSLRAALENPIDVRNSAVEEIMVRSYQTIELYETIPTAKARLASSEQDCLIVVDSVGQYVGILTAADLLSRVWTPVKPPVIGGMATPFGVYLTTGSVTSGPKGWKLASTGALILGLYFLSDAIVYLLSQLVSKFTHLPLITWSHLSFIGNGTEPDSIGAIVRLLVVAMFFVLLRALPLTGAHAAEHQVVHAIERGERLTVDVVRRMPRVHPRCGTNLMVGAAFYLTVTEWSQSRGWGEVGLLGSLLLTISLWRRIGAVVQQYLTTKPATDAQLEDAIHSGEELLAAHNRRGVYFVPFYRRLLHSGMPQTLLGYAFAMIFVLIIEQFTKLNLPLIGP